jgi:hypothetical protein
MFLVDPGCKTLIRGFRYGYRYKIKKNGEIEDRPDKNEHSHLADSLQYACLIIDMSVRGIALQSSRREVKKATYAY